MSPRTLVAALIANDNNFPGSSGRVPGPSRRIEAVVVRVSGLQ